MTRSNEPSRATQGSPPARSLGIAAVDPVPFCREGLSSIVQRTPGLHWAGHAGNPHAALQLAEQVHPDVILLDSGLDPHGHLTKLLVTGDPSLLVVLLVRDAHRTAAFLQTAQLAGAHAALPRTSEARRLVEAIRRVHLDRRYLDPALAPLTGQQRQGLRPGEPVVATRRPRMPLSRREFQVLQLVAEGLENAAIAKILYLSVETVRTHVKSILRKLSARDRTHAVTIAFRGGILICQPEDVPEGKTPGPAANPPSGMAEHQAR
ncbi:DNA-binding NarL/FixJ family response regulator [Amycolatopsis bartoniae]|uniref:Helix-turn-helix transcriptional regulator n=1 Tax=Amycolatopsis bartoniae TaxID=941986 RepID=A0A8H9IT32_9PSEU|nr:response regulator transcription factor [Amycolatopsis bartoniae]MBB2933116.1 DNA-binding NarL/FixJ family response regulator [Amycolatopsis bartoniae]TVT11883.1 response regulator transcription factor [Amycolatopsis bartoniae]GHF57190.1 helix-turn-helix transcriptional regulator [Amycolatopsis bartoniae]